MGSLPAAWSELRTRPRPRAESRQQL